MASLNVFCPSVVGVDVHKKSLVCCARRLVGETWKEAHATFGTTKEEILSMAQWCKQFNPNFILMESTGVYWMSPYTYLERAGLRVYIVNPRSVKGMIGKKTDKSDAQWLATKGNEGSFKPSYIPVECMRKLRDVSRHIIMMVQESTRHKNRITKMFLAMGYRIDSVFSDPFGKNAERAKDAILAGKTPIEVLNSIDTKRLKASEEELLEAFNGDLDEERVRVINTSNRIVKVLQEEINENKQFLIDEVKKLEPKLFELFQTIPGIDEYHAATLIIEFGGKQFRESFSNAEKFASWLGLNHGNKESGGKRYQCKSGHGNWAARRCLCEAAHAASHANGTTIQSRYRSLRSRIGTKKAVIASAHYMARLAYVVASKESPYEDPCIDYVGMAFDKSFKRYVQKAIQYKEKWSVDVTNLETGESFQSEDASHTATKAKTSGTNSIRSASSTTAKPRSVVAPAAQPKSVIESHKKMQQLMFFSILMLIFVAGFVLHVPFAQAFEKNTCARGISKTSVLNTATSIQIESVQTNEVPQGNSPIQPILPPKNAQDVRVIQTRGSPQRSA